MGSRLLGIVVKELIQLHRDLLTLILALLVPVAMLFIFGWAINTDVKHVRAAVWDQSGTFEARTFLEAMVNSQYFDIYRLARNREDLTRFIDEGTAKVGVVIPPDFAVRMTRQRAEIQMIIDASDPLVAISAVNAASALGAQQSLQVLTRTTMGTPLERHVGPPLDVRVRAWYNPDLVSAVFIIPGLIGALLMQTTIAAVAVSVVREREKGTLEALMVSPIRSWELLLGKVVPTLLVAYGQMTMLLVVAHVVFDVPVRGNVGLLYALTLLFMLSTLGIGLLVSTVSRTVPQAMQLAFVTFLPSTYLSGLLFPIEGMPTGAQHLASIIPLTYFLRIIRGIALKGVGLDDLWPSVLPLALFGVAILSMAVFTFRKQLD
jgi:ABC-2 type transport system permease protein